MCISLLCAGQSAFSLRLMFSFDVKREPENHQRFRRAGSTRKGLLAPFRPRRSCRNGKKLAASLNAFFSFLRFGVAMRRGRGEGKVKLTGKEKTLCEAVSPGDGCGAVCSLRYCWCCWWRSCSSTAPPAATTTRPADHVPPLFVHHRSAQNVHRRNEPEDRRQPQRGPAPDGGAVLR